jgi:hypothetical protein
MFIKVEQDPLENPPNGDPILACNHKLCIGLPPRPENRCHLDYLGATRKERNARVFNNKATAVMQRIEEESKNMIMVGAKHLAKLTT